MTQASTAIFQRVAIIGCGLIGSSLARAIKARGLAGELAVVDADADARDAISALGFADQVSADATAGATGADCVIVATPVGALKNVIDSIAPVLKPGCVVSDVGSVKGAAVAAGAGLPDNVYFVPGHPVSGTENSGPEAGFETLFDGRWCILTPSEARLSEPGYAEAVDRLAALWRACGADIEIMSAEHHDLALAVTSHVPHLIAYNIVGTADDIESVTQAEVIKYAAGGFRDFTRIAASDPVMWRDVFLNNREAVLEVLSRFSEDLAALQRAIRWGDGDALYTLFSRTREIRRQVIDAGQETAAPNFGRDDASDEDSETEEGER